MPRHRIPDLTAETLANMSLLELDDALEAAEQCERICRDTRDHDGLLQYAEAVDILRGELSSRRSPSLIGSALLWDLADGSTAGVHPLFGGILRQHAPWSR